MITDLINTALKGDCPFDRRKIIHNIAIFPS